MGYQRVRIVPGLSGSGCYWRCAVTHIGNILARHGALCKDFDCDTAKYTSGQDNCYFGWEDARHDSAWQLAEKFVVRFPTICNRGTGVDWPYAGWYVQMLGFVDRGIFPIAYADWYDSANPRWLATTEGLDGKMPMPPGGEASDGSGEL